MESKGDSAVRTLLVAVGLGVFGAALFQGVGFGVNFSLWVLSAIGGVLFCARGLSRTTLLGLLIVGLSSIGLGWYSSPDLAVANVIALVGGLGVATLGVRSFRVGVASVWDLSGRLVGDALRSLGEGVVVLNAVPWKGLAQSRVAQKNTAVLRGALIATPLVLLFGALFSRADAVFNQTVVDAFSIDFSGVGEWFWLSVLFSVVGLGFVGAFSSPLVRKPPVAVPLKELKIGMAELSVVMCSLCGLFGLFVAIQFQYFFGGSAAVVETTGLTFAEYARKGFFELVWVAGLALPLLVGAHAVSPSGSRRDVVVFRSFATVLSGLLFVVMASAMVRMQLYVESYGLTPLRVSVSAFMLWLALVFCWFLASLYRGAMDRFAVGAMTAGFSVIALLNFATPDRITAQYNVARFGSSSDLDSAHLAELGAETVPYVLDSFDGLSASSREKLHDRYRDRMDAVDDWRGASVSELIAKDAFERYSN